MRCPSSVWFALCLGLALAGPAKRIEKKSIADGLAAKSIEPVDQKLDHEPAKLTDAALLEDAGGETVDRAKKQASTTFCVEIRQNKQTPVDCVDKTPIVPVTPPPPPPTPEPEPPKPEPKPVDVPCEPEIGAYYVQPPGEIFLAPTGQCLPHVPGLISVPSGPAAGPAGPLLPGVGPFGPSLPGVSPYGPALPGLGPAGAGVLQLGPGPVAGPVTTGGSIIPLGTSGSYPHGHVLAGSKYALPAGLPGQPGKPYGHHALCPHHSHHVPGVPCTCALLSRSGLDELGGLAGAKSIEGFNLAPGSSMNLEDSDGRYTGLRPAGMPQQAAMGAPSLGALGSVGGMGPMGGAPMVAGLPMMPMQMGGSVPMGAAMPMGPAFYGSPMPMMRTGGPGDCLEDSFSGAPSLQGLRLSRGPEEAEADAAAKETKSGEQAKEVKRSSGMIDKLKQVSAGGDKEDKSSRIARFIMKEKDEAFNRLDSK